MTADEVSERCAEDPDGCVLDLAIDGLRNAGFDVEELTAANEDEAQELLRATVTDANDPRPIVVTLHNPFLASVMDHAVVIVNIERTLTSDGAYDLITFMDPLTGRMEQDATGLFWQQWDFAGQRTFIIQP